MEVLKKGDRVMGNMYDRDEPFTVIRVDEGAQALNVLCKADYDDIEIWLTSRNLTKIED